MPVILQTLNTNNSRTTTAKSINLHTIRKLIEYSLKTSWWRYCLLLPFSRYWCLNVGRYYHPFSGVQGAKGLINVLVEFDHFTYFMKKNRHSWRRPFVKRQTSGTTSDNKWYNEWQQVVQWVTTNGSEWQRVTMNDNEWYNEWQRVTKSGTTSDCEWQRVRTSDNEWQRVQQMTTSNKKWQWVTANDSEW